MAFKFESLQVWQKGLDLTDEIDQLTKKSFPKEELYVLTSQIKRAADSVVLNIAEGCSRKSEAERKRFFEISRGSLIEVDAAFDIANDLGYFGNNNLTTLGELTNKTFGMLSKMLPR